MFAELRPWKECVFPMHRSRIARPLARVTLLSVAMLLSIGTTSVPQSQPPFTSADPGDTTAKLSPEVRLRKLHLVRPDLIPYPIALEVYC